VLSTSSLLADIQQLTELLPQGIFLIASSRLNAYLRLEAKHGGAEANKQSVNQCRMVEPSFLRFRRATLGSGSSIFVDADLAYLSAHLDLGPSRTTNPINTRFIHGS
jgi:hypothetical protein